MLYAAATVRCGFWESIARNRFAHRKNRELPTSTVNAMRIVTLNSTESLVLPDLRGDGPIRIGAPTAVAHDTNHAAGRALSAETYAMVPDADGFVFPSRFTGHTCIAVFGRATHKLKALSVLTLNQNTDFLNALDDYDITLIDERK